MRSAALLSALLASAPVHARAASSLSTNINEPVERLPNVPEGWAEAGTPPQDMKMYFRVAVRSADHALLERTLMEISSPNSRRYGQHLKRHQLKDLIKPRPESSAAVLRWLETAGIHPSDIVNDGEWINFHAPVKHAQEMMDATFATYQSTVRPSVKKVRSLSYTVPSEVRSHIDLIYPITRFGQLHPERSHILTQGAAVLTAAVNASCNASITPQCLADLYKFADYKPDPRANTKIATNGFLDQYARYSDFQIFARNYAPNAAGSNFSYTLVSGGRNDQNSMNDSGEANLDIQYTAGLLAPNINTNFFSTGGLGPLVPDVDQPTQSKNQNEPYMEFFSYLVNLDDADLPSVLTTSYGETEQSVEPLYAKKVCDMIGQLGTRGVSIIFSSGDSGPGSGCQTNDGKNTTRFQGVFPAACPYVTSVGGTTKVEPEQAANFSSGGFSDIWDRPSYQDAAVNAYLEKLGNTWAGLYNPKGRGFPDVAAQGRRFRVVDKGVTHLISGTSASAPVFASVVALLNNARVAAGKPVLGFLNPWIYEKGYQGLNDIVDGGSAGCSGRSIYSKLPAARVPYASWNATQGWDPVTGYGTPDFEQLLRLSQGGGYGGRRGLDGKA